VHEWLKEGKDVRLGDWKTAEIEIMNSFQLLSAKPVVYLVCSVPVFRILYSLNTNTYKTLVVLFPKCRHSEHLNILGSPITSVHEILEYITYST
jgi:hypothetical protein